MHPHSKSSPQITNSSLNFDFCAEYRMGWSLCIGRRIWIKVL
jgi:hypothetical protein